MHRCRELRLVRLFEKQILTKIGAISGEHVSTNKHCICLAVMSNSVFEVGPRRSPRKIIPMRFLVMMTVLLYATGSALAQGLSLPGTGGQGGSATEALRSAFAEQTPEQRRAFCSRVAQAAAGCGIIDMTALSACLMRTLPAQDSARVARVANASRGNVSGLMQECGITLGR